MEVQVKLLVTASATLLLSASTVMAADPVDIAPAPMPVASAHDWSGFYIGVSGGLGGGSNDAQFQNNGFQSVEDPGGFPLFAEPTTWYDFAECFINGVGGWGGEWSYCGNKDNSFGGFAGGQVGYNFQSGNIVFGVEADAFWSSIKSEGSSTWGYDYGGDVYGGTDTVLETELEYFGTIRGRIGVAMDRFLPYVTGGAAWGHVNTSVQSYNWNNDDPDTWIDPTSSGETLWGYTVGIGGEYAFTDRLSLKAEYLYIDLGDSSASFAYNDGGPLNIESENKYHTLKVGLNLAF